MRNIKLNDIIREENYNYYILAETAFSHEGDVEYLKKQIDYASNGGCNGLKFQILLDAKDSYTSDTEIFENFEKWKISEKEWIKILRYAKSKTVEVVVLPIDTSSIDFVKKNINLIDALELHSICFNEVPFIRKLKTIPINIILGVGGRSKEDIDFVLNELRKNNSINRKIFFMYGFQSFPTNYEYLNLLKIKSLTKRYNLITGYADHTSFTEYKKGFELIKLAYMCGTRIFEKHLVLERGIKRIDYETAIGSNELLELQQELDSLIKTLGNGNLSELNEAERKYRYREKKFVIKSDLKKGESLNPEILAYKVTKQKSDLEQKDYDKIINKRVKVDIKRNTVLKLEHIEL